VRVILATVAGLKAWVAGKAERRTLVGVAFYDGLGGMVLGWWLGSWNGKVPGL